MKIDWRYIVIWVGCVMSFVAACRTYIPPLSDEYISLLNRDVANISNVKLNSIYRQVLPKYHIVEQWKAGKPEVYNDSPYVDNALILFKNGKIYYNSGIWFDSSTFSQNFNWAKAHKEYTGVYQIIGDTLKAIIYNNVQVWFKFNLHLYGLSALRECHYTGIVKNRDTILGWRMLPDWSGIDSAFPYNHLVFKELMTPKDLYLTGLETKMRL